MCMYIEVHVHLWTFVRKPMDRKALNYIPTSCSCAEFLFLVTFLNLALIYGDIPSNLQVQNIQDYGFEVFTVILKHSHLFCSFNNLPLAGASVKPNHIVVWEIYDLEIFIVQLQLFQI